MCGFLYGEQVDPPQPIHVGGVFDDEFSVILFVWYEDHELPIEYRFDSNCFSENCYTWMKFFNFASFCFIVKVNESRSSFLAEWTSGICEDGWIILFAYAGYLDEVHV